MKRMIVIMIVAVFMSSCAARQTVSMPAERVFKDAEIKSDSGVNLPLEDIISLEKRVKAYWDARLEDDWVKAYEYEDPEIKKQAKLTVSKYIGGKASWIDIKNYDVKRIELLEPDKVRFYIVLDASIDLPIGKREKKDEKVPIKDLWLKRGGEWYRFLALNPFQQVPIEQGEIKITPEGIIKEDKPSPAKP